jgi:hypothetical protein
MLYNQVKYKHVSQLSPFLPIDSTDKEDGSSDSDSSNDTNNDDDEVVLKLDWKSESTIYKDNSLELMILKASIHVN